MSLSLNQKLLFILIILLVIPMLPLFRPGFYFMQDDLQAFRVHQMSKCLADFQIPCRWVPDMGYQYGYPQFNYYPPSIFYLGAVMHLLGIQFIDTVKILFIGGFILSGLAMYLFIRAWLGEISALTGAVLYSYAPFKAVEIYVRGSLSELWAFVFFPLIFWSSLELIRTAKTKYLVYLAVFWGLLLITHNLMSFIFLPIFVIWIGLLVILNRKWIFILKFILSGVLGLSLAAFFTLPVIFEAKYVHLETLLGGYFDYRQHFVTLRQLFLSNYFGYGSSILGPNDDLSLSLGIVHWIIGGLALILAMLSFKKNKSLSIIAFSLGVVELAVIFLMHQKSSFIWDKLPSLWYLQFPWRFLSNSVFLLSMLGAIFIFLLRKYSKEWSVTMAILILAAVFMLHGSFFKPKQWFDISDWEKFSGESWQKQLTISIFDYLPIYAKFPPNKIAPNLPEILDGQANFIDYQKGSDYQKGKVIVNKIATVRLPLFDFPGMEVLMDGKKVTHWHNDCRMQPYCFGLITISFPPGSHQVEAHLTNTPIRQIGNIITLIGIFVTIYLFYLKKNELPN